MKPLTAAWASDYRGPVMVWRVLLFGAMAARRAGRAVSLEGLRQGERAFLEIA